MKKILLSALLVSGSIASFAQDHGSLSFNGQAIALTGYRTRISNDKRWVIAEGKKDGKLYSITVTLRPDVTAAGNVKADATHSITVTTSNADYSKAENFCFDGGSTMMVTPQNGKYTITGKDMQSGDCFGKSKGSDKVSFTIKP